MLWFMTQHTQHILVFVLVFFFFSFSNFKRGLTSANTHGTCVLFDLCISFFSNLSTLSFAFLYRRLSDLIWWMKYKAIKYYSLMPICNIFDSSNIKVNAPIEILSRLFAPLMHASLIFSTVRKKISNNHNDILVLFSVGYRLWKFLLYY